MQRRHSLVALAALGAALAGWGVYRLQNDTPPQDKTDLRRPVWNPKDLDGLAFLNLPNLPQGHVPSQAFLNRPLWLNFWATWCPPCVEEMPLLDAFYKLHRAKDWQVLGCAADSLERVQAFLHQHPVHYPVAIAQDSALSWSRALGNTQGGLPFTVLFDRQGQLLWSQTGPITAKDLEKGRKMAESREPSR